MKARRVTSLAEYGRLAHACAAASGLVADVAWDRLTDAQRDRWMHLAAAVMRKRDAEEWAEPS